MGVEVGGIGSGSGYDGLGKGGVKGITEMKLRGDKARNGSAKGSSPPNGSSAVYNASTRSEEEGGAKEDAVKHYDADGMFHLFFSLSSQCADYSSDSVNESDCVRWNCCASNGGFACHV